MMQPAKKGLTKREKRLLFVVGCAGSAILMFQFVLMPWYVDMGEKEEELVELRAEQQRLEMTLATAQGIRLAFEAALANDAELRERYFNESILSDVGRYLTLLVMEHDFLPTSQSLSPAVNFTASGDDITTFGIVRASMSINGNYAELKSLLDTVREIPYVRIPSLSFSMSGSLVLIEFLEEDDEDGVYLGQFFYADSDTSNVSLTFEVTTMRDREQFEDEEQDVQPS